MEVFAIFFENLSSEWKDVSKELDTSLHGAEAIYKRYLKLDLNQQQ